MAELNGSYTEANLKAAFDSLEFLEAIGDPAAGPIGDTGKDLAATVAGETHEFHEFPGMYPGMARTGVKKGSQKSQIGLSRLPRPSVCTPDDSKKRSTS